MQRDTEKRIGGKVGRDGERIDREPSRRRTRSSCGEKETESRASKGKQQRKHRLLFFFFFWERKGEERLEKEGRKLRLCFQAAFSGGVPRACGAGRIGTEQRRMKRDLAECNLSL